MKISESRRQIIYFKKKKTC